MTVILGGNRVVDCPTILAYEGTPVLRVVLGPLRIEFQTPSKLRIGRPIVVDEAGVHPPDAAATVVTDRSFSVFSGDHAILIATLLDADTVHLKLDLRPVGMNIFDDVAGFHVGQNVFSGNEVRNCAVAINLA